ncbi:TPA: hypothetical protein ACH3X3_012077 [Trebouxia sp. C0006]
MGVSIAADLTAGTFAGATSLVVGHPFDTIKVKLQSQPRPLPGYQPQYASALDAVRKTIAEGGVFSLFRGMGAPFATVAFYNAVLFAARGQMESMLAHPDGSPLSMSDQAIAGLGAGTVGALIACPTELIKCRIQAQAGSKASAAHIHAASLPAGLATLSQSGKGLASLTQAKGFSTLPLATATSGTTPGAIHLGDYTGSLQYKGPMDVMRQVMRSEGGVIGLYKGLVPTLLREVPGCAAMFAAYEAIKLGAAKQQGLSNANELGKGTLMVAGGAAGAVYWLTVYPADIIKSKLQTDSYRQPAYRGTLHCARQVCPHFFAVSAFESDAT